MLRRPSVPGGSNGSIIRGFETPLHEVMHAEHHSNCAENECVRSFCDFAICESSQIAKFRRIYTLKRFLSIFSTLIFDSRVDPGIPSLAAAPDSPDTRPLHSRSAASIISFSCAASC